LIRDHAVHLVHVAPGLFFVMPGLDPGIHRPSQDVFSRMDCRVKPGNDELRATLASKGQHDPDLVAL
jgi:hypothetical protein